MTSTAFVERLREVLATLPAESPHALGVRKLMADAAAGKYHDFKSPLVAPKNVLAVQLRLIGLQKLADDVMRGVYDEDGAPDAAVLAAVWSKWSLA